MKWSEVAKRLKTMVGISSDTDIEPEQLISKLENMVQAADTVVTESTDVKGDIESLREQISSITEVLASHKETMESILQDNKEFKESVESSLQNITSAISSRKEKGIALESLTVQKEDPVEKEPDKNENLKMDINLVHKANRNSWHR